MENDYKSYFVPISNGNEIRTIESSTESSRLPLVLLHGFGAGVALWSLNFEILACKQKVYAIDILGFGRSSRPQFPTDGAEAEKLFVQSIEEWRKQIGLEKFILLGHSFGGYLACSYSVAYPERVAHLILADPWGIPEKSTKEPKYQIPTLLKIYYSFHIMAKMSFLTIGIVSGPWGKLRERFSYLDYILFTL